MDCLVSEPCKQNSKAEKCQQHVGKKLFCCEGCNKEIVSNLKMQKHILTNSVGKPFICDVCAEAFGQKIELVMHMVKHNGQKLLQDEKTIADEEEARGDNLVESRLISVKNELHESFPCDVCHQEITQKDGSVTHICAPVLNKTLLSKNTKMKMNECDLYQNVSSAVKTEIHKCDLCEYFSVNATKFRQHMCKHNVDPVGVGFQTRDLSSDNVTESCDICGREFTSKSSLFRHIRTHTGEKPFTCGVCQKEFAQRGTLRRHLQIHTGHKPFRCKVCTREFTQSCTLVRHMRTHTGEKPYKCNVCDKRFSQNGALLQHIRLHTGERPYKCSICRRSFSTNKHLLSHVSTHTKEEVCCRDGMN